MDTHPAIRKLYELADREARAGHALASEALLQGAHLIEGRIVYAADIKTLRDEFAMAALTGALGHPSTHVQSATAKSVLATHCYQMADAMLFARQEVQP